MAKRTDKTTRKTRAAAQEQAQEPAAQRAWQIPADMRQDALKMLRAGISWRRLAYLLQVAEATCRRAILADPELAAAKRPEGWAAELALADSYARLDTGDPGAVRAWVQAKTTYDTSRAKNAHYRHLAQQAAAQEQQQEIKAQLDRACPMPDVGMYSTRCLNPELAAWEDERAELTAQLEQQQQAAISDYDTGAR